MPCAIEVTNLWILHGLNHEGLESQIRFAARGSVITAYNSHAEWRSLIHRASLLCIKLHLTRISARLIFEGFLSPDEFFVMHEHADFIDQWLTRVAVFAVDKKVTISGVGRCTKGYRRVGVDPVEDVVAAENLNRVAR